MEGQFHRLQLSRQPPDNTQLTDLRPTLPVSPNRPHTGDG